ncbi:MAG TPA: hypothetical protein VMI31_01995 [Fimbriimonadaceae bacterium]|nr:hypothetical protein [Fimbriimonadaceae bacterium]
MIVRSDPGDNEAALLLLRTKAEKLPTGFAGADLATAAILDCLNPADEESYYGIVKLICRAHPDWTKDGPRPRDWGPPWGAPIFKCPPGPLVTYLRSKLDRANSKIERSRLWELLLRWRIPGALEGYFASLRPLLRDPSAYADDEASAYWGLVTNLEDVTIEFNAKDQEDEDDVLRDLLTATNPILAIYWMEHRGALMDARQQGRFAQLLDWMDPRVQYEVTEILASQLHDPAHAPKTLRLRGRPRGSVSRSRRESRLLEEEVRDRSVAPICAEGLFVDSRGRVL